MVDADDFRHLSVSVAEKALSLLVERRAIVGVTTVKIIMTRLDDLWCAMVEDKKVEGENILIYFCRPSSKHHRHYNTAPKLTRIVQVQALPKAPGLHDRYLNSNDISVYTREKRRRLYTVTMINRAIICHFIASQRCDLLK